MHTSAERHPVVMTIAGSDSGGGAGIQADLKVITCLDGFGVSVITALTAQNGAEVRGVHEVPADFVVQQLQTVLSGFPVKSAKTGMLFSQAIAEALSPYLQQRQYPLVVDPVCVSQSGYQLLHDDAVGAVKELILPHADLLTPNVPEAELLSGGIIRTEQDVEDAIACLLSQGARHVLLKGGHFEGYSAPDVITDWFGTAGQPVIALHQPRQVACNNHGTGCSLSAAIATFLGYGYSMLESVKKGQAYLARALASAYAPGIGAGPPYFMAGRSEYS